MLAHVVEVRLGQVSRAMFRKLERGSAGSNLVAPDFFRNDSFGENVVLVRQTTYQLP